MQVVRGGLQAVAPAPCIVRGTCLPTFEKWGALGGTNSGGAQRGTEVGAPPVPPHFSVSSSRAAAIGYSYLVLLLSILFSVCIYVCFVSLIGMFCISYIYVLYLLAYMYVLATLHSNFVTVTARL